MNRFSLVAFVLVTIAVGEHSDADHPLAAPGVTSLTNSTVDYQVIDRHHVTLQRGDITAIIVDNAAIDLPELPGHRAGYNGGASLRHAHHDTNLFVSSIAGLNFEHIHDGTRVGLKEKFEPRKFPMQLRMMFRPRDQIWMAQSPSGGGNGNPAWDFQWFISDFNVGRAYGFRMPAAYLPFESQEQIERATQVHRDALGDD